MVAAYKGLQFFLWKCLSCPRIEWFLQIKWWLIDFVSYLVSLHFKNSTEQNGTQNYVALTARSSVFVFESFNNGKIFQVSGHSTNMCFMQQQNNLNSGLLKS